MTAINNVSESLKVLAVKGLVTFSAQNLILKVIWFLTSLVLLNSVTIFDYSVLRLVFATIAVPSALYIAGVDSMILADMGVERESGKLGTVKSLFRSYVVFEIVSAVIIWSGFIFFISFFKDFFSPPTLRYLFAASFLIFSRPLQNIVIQFFNLFFSFRRVTLLKLYEAGMTLAAMAFFVFYLRQGIYAAILIQVVAPFIATCLSLPTFVALYRKNLQSVSREPAGFYVRLKAHGKWAIASSYVLTGSDSLRLFFIDHFIGRGAVALYSLADALWNHLTSLFPVKSILDVMIPQSSKAEAVARQSLIRGFKYALLGFTALGVLSSVGGYPFLRTFFPKYVAAFPIFLGLLLMIPRLSFSAALGPLLRAYKFQLAGFSAALTSLFLTIGLAYVLYPIFGMAGVVSEFIITNTLLIYIVYRAFIKKYPAFKINMREIFSWDSYDAEMFRILFYGLRQRLKLRR